MATDRVRQVLPPGRRLEPYESPCVGDPWPFEQSATLKAGRNLDRAREACIAACGRCEPEHRAWCLREHFDAKGVVAGLTERQRKTWRKRLEAKS